MWINLVDRSQDSIGKLFLGEVASQLAYDPLLERFDPLELVRPKYYYLDSRNAFKVHNLVWGLSIIMYKPGNYYVKGNNFLSGVVWGIPGFTRKQVHRFAESLNLYQVEGAYTRFCQVLRL